MSGVLQRLAMRVLPAPGGVRPRLGSRFEGFAGRAEPDAAEIASQPGIPVHRAPAAPGPVPKPRASKPSARTAAEPPAAELPPAIGAGEPSPAAADPPRARAQAPMPAPLIDVAADDLRNPFPAAAPLPPASTPAAAARRARRGDPPAKLRQPSPGTLPAASGDGPRTLPAAPGDGPGPAAARPEALLLPPVPAPPAPIPAGGHDLRSEPAPAPPDIHVSIGRIEIRADRGERRPAARAPSRPSLMSLEDYLGKGRARR
ncbi:MAG: hypothetical protein QOG13_307 [Sphingomonadales bacterium]|jgi:hypothetical protein|nr:hypothetical protein [Sphingomonadales bacterium]